MMGNASASPQLESSSMSCILGWIILSDDWAILLCDSAKGLVRYTINIITYIYIIIYVYIFI